MPRTSKVDSPGCPPLRALTFDALGLIKVTEARRKEGGVAKVVERWGEPDSSRCVLAASIDDRQIDPLLAVARKNGLIDVISPINGDIRVSISNESDLQPKDDALVGLYLFKKRLESSSSCTLLTCTTKGVTSLRSVEVKSPGATTCDENSMTWNVCAAGNILCSKVHEDENYAIFGGKGIEVNVWDLEKHSKIWTAKSPPKNSLGIFTPTWFTSATFLSKDDPHKFVAGTNSNQVRLYDISAQRRPVLSFNFREAPIKTVAEDLDGHTIYVGNASGDLASFDMRTGKLLGCFLGKCSGSIRSIVRHPELPVIASCGLDCFLRIWDIKSRQLLSAILIAALDFMDTIRCDWFNGTEVFLKQHLTDVVFDSHFSDEEVAVSAPPPTSDPQDDNETVDGDEEESLPVKRKKSSKSKSGIKKKKSKKLRSDSIDES